MIEMEIVGTYRSQSGDFVIEISKSDDSVGTFSGTYTARATPEGMQQFLLVSGSWGFINNPNGKRIPLNISLIALIRPNSWNYCIYDAWAGVLVEDGTILATGVRSYLKAGEPAQLSSLGIHTFINIYK